MRYIDFEKELKDFKIISYPDIVKVDPSFDRRRLVEWQQKDFIQKIRKGYYSFKDIDVNEALIYYTSNIIYKPSYISLQSALSYYNFIPEAVYNITAISTRKTNSFDTPLGSYLYRNIKKNLFFGYVLINKRNHTIKMANSEKALLDMMYLNLMSSSAQIEGLRINTQMVREQINFQRLNNYLDLYHSETMKKRVKSFLEYIHAES